MAIMNEDTQNRKHYQHLLDISPKMKGWVLDDVLGSGTFGTVLRIRERKGNQLCALKVIPIPYSDNLYDEMVHDCSGNTTQLRIEIHEQLMKVLEKEISVLETCRGQRNIVQKSAF